MDAHLLRLNHMSYLQQQQLINSRLNNHQQPSRNHYSQRQQLDSSRLQQQQQQQQQQHQIVNQHQKSLSSGASSGGSETNDEHLQLSSQLSSVTNKTTNSSQVAMLAHGNSKHVAASSSQQQQQLLRQQHQQHLQREQKQRQQAAMHAAGANHRQAALAAHNLQAPAANSGKSNSSGGSSSNNQHHQQQQVDQLTTSSSSEHTIDELHQLAHGYSQHRLAGRYGSADVSATSSSQSGSRFLLGVLFTLAELLLFTTALLWLYWAYQYDDGLAWQSDRKQQFNTHAALMLLGFVFLNGQAMLIYRSFQCCSKIYTKILHTILFVLATSAISLGLILGYTAQENVGLNNKPIMHFYSLHAWCGLATVGLFALQFVFGFVSFLILLCCDSATSKFRAALLPIHKTFGLIIFSLAVATSLMGLLQTARSRLSSKLNKVDYHELAQASIVINLIGVCLICLAILMPYIIRNLDIKRPFRSELERHLKLSQLEMRI